MGHAVQATLVDGGRNLFGFLLVAARQLPWRWSSRASTGFGRALYPLVVLFQNVPKVALAPIFILWFGYGLAPKIGLILVIAFFPGDAVDMLAGMQSVDRSLLALMHSVGASRTQILFGSAPHSLPQSDGRNSRSASPSASSAPSSASSPAPRRPRLRHPVRLDPARHALVFAGLAVVSVLGIAFYYAVEIARTHPGAVVAEIQSVRGLRQQ